MKKARHVLTLALAAVLVLGSQVVIPQCIVCRWDRARKPITTFRLNSEPIEEIQGRTGIGSRMGSSIWKARSKTSRPRKRSIRRAHRVKNVVAVRNKLKIAGAGEISDAQLQQKIVQKLQYDRVGYGNAFNAISVNVQDGVVTLAGNALGPVAADSAVSLASHFPGVQDVINNIQVDPLSPMDDRTRHAGVSGHLRLSQPE